MPSNLTDVDSFDPVSGPVGSDIRNAASVRSALQTAANRTRYLYNRAEPLADFAALKAINTTGFANGTTRFVTKQGPYSLDTGSSATELQPYVVQPTTGPGRWIAAAPHRTSRVLRIFPGNNVAGVHADWGTTGSVLLMNYSLLTQDPHAHYKAAFGALVCTSRSGTAANRKVHFIPLDLPDGVTITTIATYLKPTQVSLLPGTMPFVSAIRLDGVSHDGANSPLGVGGVYLYSGGHVVDSSGTIGAYNASHAITITPDQNNIVDRSQYTYQLAIAGANGTGSIDNDHWTHIDVTVSIPDARGE
jgi:hypothetical protein